MNKLFYGDNLSIMERMPKYSVDLIYLDPPFKSQQNYNLIYKTMTGKPVPEQAEAFCDTWEMDAEKEHLASTMPVLLREHGVQDYYVEFWRLWIQALRQTQPHLLAYLIYMVQRLLHMKSILKPTGAIYLHCDPEASHYIKVMMDGIFGHNNFQNEIIWQRTSSHNDSKKWGRVHDTILFYSVSGTFTWNNVYLDHDPKYVEQFYRHEDEEGTYRLDHIIRSQSMGPRPNLAYEYKGYAPEWGWRMKKEKLVELDKKGRLYWSKTGRPYLKRYLHEQNGPSIKSVITDIQPLGARSRDRLGYPTQKPKALLDRIIRASTNAGDVVFDPFCGCGTTIYAAHEAGRNWIGCDIAILAVRLVGDQLSDKYGLVKGEHYEEHGIPNSVDSALALFQHNPFQFEHWAVERVGGFPTKKTADHGIDGRIYFETGRDLGVMVLSVKGGNIRPTDIRDLIGVLASESGTHLAGFISNKEPSKAMKAAAAKAGTWEYRGKDYPCVQLLTVKDIVEDKKDFVTPSKVGAKTKRPQQKLAL